MRTGTWVSVSTGPVDDPAACKATVHKFPTTAAATSALAELVEKAKANGFIEPRADRPVPRRPSSVDEAVLERCLARLYTLAVERDDLEVTFGQDEPVHVDGELERLGRSGDGANWGLPPTYRAFLERHGSLVIYLRGRPWLGIHDARGAMLATADIEDALLDPHRSREWPFEDLTDVGIDRAVVFASHGDAWMDGWAFDSRVVGDDGELAIRRVHDFSVDASAMEAEWPPHDALATTRPHRFVDWLHERIDELERSVRNPP